MLQAQDPTVTVDYIQKVECLRAPRLASPERSTPKFTPADRSALSSHEFFVQGMVLPFCELPRIPN